jgi:hypothetical protein
VDSAAKSFGKTSNSNNKASSVREKEVQIRLETCLKNLKISSVWEAEGSNSDNSLEQRVETSMSTLRLTLWKQFKGLRRHYST